MKLELPKISARFKPKRKFYVFLVCLATASGFWLLNTLARQHYTSIDSPVKYILPEEKDYIISNQPTPYLNIGMHGDGFSLLFQNSPGQSDTLYVNLKRFLPSDANQRNRILLALSSGQLKQNIIEKLNDNVTIEDSDVDTVHIILERSLTKALPIQLPNHITPASQYTFKSAPVIVPDSVIVKGPVSVVQKMDYVNADTPKMENVKNSGTVDVRIKQPDSKITIEPVKAEIRYEIEALTEGEFNIPVQVDGLPDSAQISLFPSKVNVRFTAGLSRFDLLKPSDFEAHVHFNEIHNEKLMVRVNTTSEARIISFQPEQVEFLVRKND